MQWLVLALLAALVGAVGYVLWRKRRQPLVRSRPKLRDIPKPKPKPPSLIEQISPGKLRCRGPRDLNLEGLLERMARQDRIKEAAVIKQLTEMYGGEYNTLTAISALLAAGEAQLARLLDKYARMGCGYDIRELIAEHPLDGEEHEAPCPGCGRMVDWRAPRLD